MNLQDLFTVASLSASINKLPVIPSKVGAMGIFEEKGVTTTAVVIDEYEGRLVLVPNASRDADPAAIKGGKRGRRIFERCICHWVARCCRASCRALRPLVRKRLQCLWPQ